MSVKHFISSSAVFATAIFSSLVLMVSCGGTTTAAAAEQPQTTTPASVTSQRQSAETATYTPKTTVETDELDAAIREASDYLNKHLTAGNKLAFLNIQSSFPALSEYIIEELIANTVNDKVFEAVDRQQLDAIRAEMKFQMSGEVDDESVQEAGRILGAQTIVSGSVTQIGNIYRLRVRALGVQNARIVGQFNRNIKSGTTIDALASAQPAHTPVMPTQTATAQTSAAQPFQSIESGQVSQQAQSASTQATQTVKVKTVKIGDRRWMAENLNVKTADSWCYDNNDSYCSRYGRLYSWEAAMKACDGIGDGWRLPTRIDWQELLKDVGGERTAGAKLRTATGWRPYRTFSPPPGTDNFGFSALPGGSNNRYKSSSNSFNSVGESGYWWSADKESLYIGNLGESVSLSFNYKNELSGLSVRCVKDEL